jgi:hypothetical protein
MEDSGTRHRRRFRGHKFNAESRKYRCVHDSHIPLKVSELFANEQNDGAE